MTRAELIAKIRAYGPDYTLEELEGSDIQCLKYLLRLMEMHSDIERRDAPEGGSNRSQMRGDEPPKLDAEDERILDRIWGQIAEEESAGDAN